MTAHDDGMNRGALDRRHAADGSATARSSSTGTVIARTIATSATGLRERKFRRTRARLVQTAAALLLDAGYQKATVERITAATEVSARTFSRYFGSKDDVFLAVLEPLSDAVLDELTKMPFPSAPLEALRAAHVAVLTRIAAQPMGAPSADQLATMFRVVRSSTALRAKVVQYRDQRVTTTLAEKMGVADDDYRIKLAVTVFTVAAVSAGAHVEADRFTPAVALQRIQIALADVVDTDASLDVRSLRAPTATWRAGCDDRPAPAGTVSSPP